MNIKRALAIVLSVIMVMTLLPIAAFAEGETPEAGSTTVNGLSIVQSGSILVIEKDGTAEGATYVCDGAIWASIANVNPSEITEIQVGEGVVLGENAFSGFAALQAVKLTGTIGGDGENATLPNQIAATAFAGLSSVDVVYWYFAEDEEHVVRTVDGWDSYIDSVGLGITDNYGAEQLNWINLPIIDEPEHYNSLRYGPDANGNNRWSMAASLLGYDSYVLNSNQIKYGIDSVNGNITIYNQLPKEQDKAVFDSVVNQFSSLVIINVEESFSFTVNTSSRLSSVEFNECKDITITNDGCETLALRVHDTKITVNGNVASLFLASSPSTISDITVTGNVDSIDWYSNTYSEQDQRYGGSLHVGGVVGNGRVFDGVEESYVGVGSIIVNTIGRTFSNVTGDIILNGELTCEYTQEEYTPSQDYQYTYYCQTPTSDSTDFWWYMDICTGDTSTRLELYFGAEVENNMFDSFSVDDIYYLPEGRTSFRICDTDCLLDSEPLVINVPEGKVLGELSVPNGNVEVHGNVKTISADGKYYRNIYRYPAISLLVDGNVDEMWIDGRCKHANITMTAGSTIGHGARVYPSFMNMDDRYFENVTTSEETLIMEDGSLNVFAYNANDNFGLILPSMEEVGAAVGVGNDEFASVVVNNSSEGALTEEEKTALETAIGDTEAYVVAVVNMNVNEYSEEDGYIGSVSELNGEVGIQYDFDTVGNLTAIDLHNSDGTIEASNVGEAESGEILTITTDKFSSFVILSDNAEDEVILPEEPQYYMFRSETGAMTSIEKSQFTRPLWSGFVLNSIETPNGTMLYIDEIKKNGVATVVSFTKEPTGNTLDILVYSYVGFMETEDGLEIILIPGLTIVDRTDNQYISSTVLVDNPYTDDVVLTFETDANIWILGDMPLYPVYPAQDEILTIGTYEMTMTQVPSNVVIAAGTYKVKTTIDEQGNYTLILLADYQIIEGANSTWDETEESVEEGVLIRSNAPYADFVRVEMDGEIVDPSNYDVSEGSTIVVFHKDFLEKLPEGKHTVSIISKNGSATTAINIVQKAEEKEDTTPDDSSTPDESKPSDDSSKPSEESGEPNNSSKPEESKTEESKPAESQPAESKPVENSSSTTETKEPAPVTSNKPDTGDRANTTAWAMCLLISMVGMLVVGKYGKKRTN